MDVGIKQCISTRADFFGQYYTVPEELKPSVDSFIADLNALGEASSDARDFEAKFASGGYQERFTELITRCTPKAYQMTDEDKQHSREVAKEIFREDRSRIMKEAALDALDHAAVMAEEELIADRREAMIEEGVYTDYTHASNAVDIASDGVGLLGRLFKKKKK